MTLMGALTSRATVPSVTMTDPRLRPLYTTAEAARYADTSATTAARWVRGYTYPTVQGWGISAPVAGRAADARLLSFYDLVEVAMVAAARKANVSMRDIRAALATATELYGTDRPMITERWKVAGRHIFTEEPGRYVNLSRHGQTAWRYIEDVMEDLEYDREAVARFFPAGREQPIVIDPTVSFGQPFVQEKGIRTGVVAARFGMGEGIQDIASDLLLTVREAEAALRFEGVWPLAA